MRLSEQLEPVVAKSFGLAAVYSGFALTVNRENSEPLGRANINYLWWAQLSNWWRRSVLVGIASYSGYPGKTGKVLFGVLLVAQSLIQLEFISDQPFRCVELPTLDDPVSDALRSINLLEPDSLIIPDDVSYPTIHLHLSMLNGNREIRYMGGRIEDQSWIKLCAALVQTATRLKELYNDAAITEALDPKNLERPWESNA